MKIMMSAVALAASLLVTACGSNDASNVVTPVVNPGIGSAMTSCQVGQVYAAAYGCLNQNSCQQGYGWVPGQNICTPGTPITTQMIYGGSATSTYAGYLSISNATQYKNLLKYMGMCDPYWVGWNFGSYNCDNWLGSPYIYVEGFTNLNGTVNLRIGSRGTSWTTGYGSLELQRTAVVRPYNNNLGVVIIATDYMGRDLGLRLVSENGNLFGGVNNMSATLMYQQVPFATTTLQRY